MKKKSLLLQVLIGACLLIGCAGDRMRYANVLNQAERQNIDFDSITNLDSIRLAVEFMDAHGSANERIRAHYLLGCAYRDLGDAPQAIESYQNAVNCADTTAIDCDYRQLSKVHSQMASLFYLQYLPYEQLTELELLYRYAMLAKDTISAINAIEHKADAFELLNDLDSIISIRLTAYNLYKEMGHTEKAALALGPVIGAFIDKGNITDARYYIGKYELESGVWAEGWVDKRKAIYYFTKGRYYMSVEMTDSAEILFRKLLNPNFDRNLHEAGYRGLYLLYKSIGQKDSLAKYADLSYQLNDASYASKATKDIQQMQALYNYTRSQKEANDMKDRADRIKLMLMGAIVVLLLLIFYIYYRKKQEESRQREHQMQLLAYTTEINKLKENRERTLAQIVQLKAGKDKDDEKIRLLEEDICNAEDEIQTLNTDIKDLLDDLSPKLKQGRMLYDQICEGAPIVGWTVKEEELFNNYFASINYKTYDRLRKVKRASRLSTHNLFYLILKEIGKTDDEIRNIMGLSPEGLRSIRSRTKPI